MHLRSNHVALKDYAYYAAGGPADYLSFPQDSQTAVKVMEEARIKALPITVLGLLSNVLVADQGIDGLVVITTKMQRIYEADGAVLAEAGVQLSDLVAYAAASGLGDLSGLVGVPGTVGGACFMNAGAYEVEISKYLRFLSLYDKTSGKVFRHEVQDGDFTYRKSFLQGSPYVVLEAGFVFEKKQPESLFQTMREVQKKRRLAQPLDMPSCGSAFKRPPGYYVGKILTDLKLKGYREGQVGVSEKHAGFIVNYGGATATEILDFYRKIQAVVEAELGVLLEPEVQLIGRWDHV